MPSSILVWSEQPRLRMELLAQARRLADSGGEVHLCLESRAGAVAPPESWASYGADVVHLASRDLEEPQDIVALMAQVISSSQVALVLVGATKTGMEVAPRLAERCGASYAAWAVRIEIAAETGSSSASCMLYAGSGLAEYHFSRPLTVLSVAEGVFEACETDGRHARVEQIEVTGGPPSLTVTGERAKSSPGTRLQDANAVVDVGRGVKSLEDLVVVRTLGDLLDAQLGCSRPVSSDRDWFPEWLGLSGAKIKPEICLTLGVSGAVQHVVGIRDSRVIAAVNSDENAAIFTQADIGVVADLNEFSPVLIERLRSRDARPAWSAGGSTSSVE